MKVSFAKIAILLMFVSSSVFANTNHKNKDSKNKKKEEKKVEAKVVYKSAIHQHKGKMVAVHFTKNTDQKVSISIKDATGKVIFFETVKKYNQAVKKYLLEKYPAGKYTVIVSNGEQELIEAIEIQ